MTQMLLWGPQNVLINLDYSFRQYKYKFAATHKPKKLDFDWNNREQWLNRIPRDLTMWHKWCLHAAWWLHVTVFKNWETIKLSRFDCYGDYKQIPKVKENFESRLVLQHPPSIKRVGETPCPLSGLIWGHRAKVKVTKGHQSWHSKVLEPRTMNTEQKHDLLYRSKVRSKSQILGTIVQTDIRTDLNKGVRSRSFDPEWEGGWKIS